MLRLHYIPWMFPIATISLATAGVSAQEYPNKVVRIVTSSVGSGSDFVARLLAHGLAGPLGQPVVVENMGSGIRPQLTVAKAPPDGYNLELSSDAHWIRTLFAEEKIPFDPVRDFSPVSLLTRSPYILVVPPSLPVKSVKELISLAKSKPRQLNYSSSAPGSSGQLAAELFKSIADVDIVGIAYSSNSAELSDLLSGQVQLTFWAGTKAIPLVEAGKLRALAVTSPQPSTLYPSLPTMAASGVPDFEWVQLSVMFAPAKTPEAIINRLNQEIVRFLNQTEVKRQLLNSGVEAVGSSPEELATTMKSQMVRIGKLIKDANIRAQ